MARRDVHWLRSVPYADPSAVHAEVLMAKGSESSRYAMSVRGLVDVAELGITLVHEHLLVDFLESPSIKEQLRANATSSTWAERLSLSNYYEMRWNSMAYSYALGLRDVHETEQALHLLAQHGGKSIVDVTPIGVGRDPLGLRALSEATDVNVIMGTGFLTRDFHPPYLADMTTEGIAASFVAEFHKGVGPAGIRPGIIGEIGLSWPLDDQETRVLEAAVRAQNEIGLPMTIHPGRHPSSPHQIVQLVQQLGGDVSKVAIGHLDRTLFSLVDFADLAETGVRLELDLFGQESRHYLHGDIDMPNDGGRIAVIAELFHLGFGDQVLISHDVSSPLRLSANGGEGYHHILHRVLPVMERRGFSDDDLRTLVVENPAAFLAIDGFP